MSHKFDDNRKFTRNSYYMKNSSRSNIDSSRSYNNNYNSTKSQKAGSMPGIFLYVWGFIAPACNRTKIIIIAMSLWMKDRLVLLYTGAQNYITGSARNVSYTLLPTSSDYNYSFYKNEIPFKPNGEIIDNIHQFWFGDCDRLEENQYYIHWLFPLPDQGKNKYAYPLTESEKNKMLKDPSVMNRMLKSFTLMLDFYGTAMRNRSYVERASNWLSAHEILKRKPHNYLRISRILKCLTAFELDDFCLYWLKFLYHEIYITKELSCCEEVMNRYWLQACSPSVRKEYERFVSLL